MQGIASAFLLKNKNSLFLMVVLSIAVIGYLNYISGKELNLFILFLIPCILSAWGFGIQIGISSAILSVSISFVTDMLLAPKTEIIILIINAIVRLCVFTLAIVYTLKIKKNGRIS